MVKCSRNLDHTFAALADPTRRQMLARLARGTASVGELAEGHRLSLPAVLKHVRSLERANLVQSEKIGRVRQCRLTARPMRDAADWLATYRQVWESRLDRLAEHLRQRGDKS